ncbi:MAG TPA: hypothetical protein VF444_09440 [Pseudonocardiaceae bacterium]
MTQPPSQPPSTPSHGDYPPNHWGDQGGFWQPGQQPGYPTQSGHPNQPGYSAQPGWADYSAGQGGSNYFQPTNDPDVNVYRAPTGGGYPVMPPPRRKGPFIAAVIAAMVLVGGGAAGVTIWLGSNGRPSGGHVVTTPTTTPTASGTLPTQFPGTSAGGFGSASATAPTDTASPSGSTAWTVGTCFYEKGTVGNVSLSPVACDSDQAVFVINSVISPTSDCPDDANYNGDVIGDQAADAYYCVSLAVPAGQCFVYDDQSDGANTQVVRRTDCGGGAYVVRVQSVEAAGDSDSACQDVPDVDVWSYQSPTSGKYACVVAAGG